MRTTTILLTLVVLTGGAVTIDDRLKHLDAKVEAAAWKHHYPSWKGSDANNVAPTTDLNEPIAKTDSEASPTIAETQPASAAPAPVPVSTKPVHTFAELYLVFAALPAADSGSGDGSVSGDGSGSGDGSVKVDGYRELYEYSCSGSGIPEANACFSGTMPLGMVNDTDAGTLAMKVRFNSPTKIHVTVEGTVMGREIAVHNLGKSTSSWWSKEIISNGVLDNARPLRFSYCPDKNSLVVSANADLFSATTQLALASDCP